MTVTERTPAPDQRPAPRPDVYEPTGDWLRRQWRRWRALVAVAALVIALGIGYGLATMGGSALRLDPSSARPDGARAVATLLEQRGVTVQRVQRFADLTEAVGRRGPSTVLVTAPETLGTDRAERLRASLRQADARLVLVEPDERALRSLAPAVHPAGDAFDDVRKPGCGWSGARRAGSVNTSGPLYRAPDASEWRTCYSDGTRGALLRSEHTAVLGAGSALTNEQLDQQGNAALGLNLLGERDRLIWYVPSATDAPATGRPSLVDLLPAQVKAATGVLGIAVVLVAVAAARRLGPVVDEPLPVRVPAAETTLGHARLYRRAHAGGPAADALREASRLRLARRLGLPATQPPAALVAAVAERTGRSESAVAEILTGGAPSDDNGLVELADALDRLEQEVSRS